MNAYINVKPEFAAKRIAKLEAQIAKGEGNVAYAKHLLALYRAEGF